MTELKSLLSEAVVIGLFVAILTLITMTIMRSIVKIPTTVHYFIMTTITGMLAHFIFEFSGINRKLCKSKCPTN